VARQAEIAARCPRGVARQHETVRLPPARAARLRRRRAQRGRHPPLPRRQRPGDRQGQGEGAGRLLHALEPQVIGAARDQLRWTREQLEIEANGVGDNPIFLPDDAIVLTGANFQGTPVSLPLDTLGAAVAMKKSPSAVNRPPTPPCRPGCRPS
jgi:hypothetical protein